MKNFVKTFTVLVLIATVTLCSGWSWGKKKAGKKAPAKSVEVKVVEPVIEDAQQKTVEQKPVEKAKIKVKAKPAAKAAQPAAKPAVKAVVTPAAKPAAADTNAVTVNGEVIKESAITDMFNKQMAQMGSRIPPGMIDQYKGRVRKQIIEQMVIERILEQKIAEKKLTASDEEVQKEVDAQLKAQNLTIDDFKSLLQAYGKNFDEYKENMKKKVMFDKLLTAELGKTEPVSEEQAKQFYDANPKQFQKPESVRTRHILISPAKDPNADPNQLDVQAKARAQEVLDKLKAGGDFAELAKQYSDGPSASKGGDLGVAPKGSFVPAFEEAAYKLEPNEISGLVKTRFGYHIIQLLERQPARNESFEEVKEQIAARLEQGQKRDAIMAYIQKIKESADVKYANPDDKMEMPPMGQGAPGGSRPTRPKAVQKPQSIKPSGNASDSNE